MSLEVAQIKSIIQSIPEGVPYMVEGNNNNEVYIGNRDCEYTYFDHEKEVLINIKPNTENNGTRYKRPIDIQIMPYSEIQKIILNVDYNKLVEYLKNEGVTEDVISTIIKRIAPLLKANINPFEKTNKTFTQDEFIALREEQK